MTIGTVMRAVNFRPTIAAKLAACLGLTAAADWLFYGHGTGWTAGLFAFSLISTLCLLQPALVRHKPSQVIATALIALSVAMMNAPEPLTFWLFASGVATLLVLHKRDMALNAVLLAKDMLRLAFRTLSQWRVDSKRCEKAVLRLKLPRGGIRRGMVFAVFPATLAAVFIYLFSEANPVLAAALTKLDWGYWTAILLSPGRWLFWGAVAAVIWALLRPRFRLSKPVTMSLAGVGTSAWVSRRSLVFSLVLFNIIFAIQNGFDLAFLWTGQGAFPAGVDYADYVHAGAYPLIVTALLAGGYVLLTFDNAQAALRSNAATALVTVWVLQNVFLVASSIDRTLNYIESYSLTYLRVAALIWMGLVAVGLLLVLARIYLNRSNMWLINVNALVLTGILYACCFMNFGGTIAHYNVHHARELGGKGVTLDLGYLREIGPDAIPALRWYVSELEEGWNRQYGGIVLKELEDGLDRDTSDWRLWTWRKQRLFGDNDNAAVLR
ncbi:MAG: DUF4173 domain-containing protein [bacterium]|nr:DUF4173 domain-containing protein [bacterium]